ncbi:S-adenosyl-L-methionine-dependent methyltransferase [Glomus cerebriforme]|uniref:S-adenosyl-L-methionine-dependent methyltransferase n=1 Tax=Glomus cerebriforme TaxID=658196 RepID=A0A397TU05_9GLOM|nr:S-adenosyl-L-methionine-dependent methyltransferase [Glomus cerebriforme]
MGVNISSERRRTGYYGRRILFDDQEIDRIQVQHHFAREAWNGNFSSPIKDVLNAGGATVLDIGCGAGTFLCEMAADYPNARYVGVDKLQIFPNTLPKNVTFIQSDILRGLPFDNDSFDFIYIRFLVFDLADYEWRMVIDEMTRILKPNGYLEMMEPRIEMNNKGPITEKIVNAIQVRARSRHLNPYIVDKFNEFMHSTNKLKNIKYEVKRIPCGKWGDKQGELGAMYMYEIFKKHLHYVNNIQPNEHDNNLNNFLKEIEQFHTYFEFVRCFAQKIKKVDVD